MKLHISEQVFLIFYFQSTFRVLVPPKKNEDFKKSKCTLKVQCNKNRGTSPKSETLTFEANDKYLKKLLQLLSKTFF